MHADRYYRNGPRRRPVRIDFCEADVLDVFDEWRRAVGLTATVERRSTPSVPAHLERALARLTSVRATGTLGARVDSVLDRLSQALDDARAAAGGVRGATRAALVEGLAALDVELLAAAAATLTDVERAEMEQAADEDLRSFKPTLPPDAYERARAATFERLLRERFHLPSLTLG